MKLVKIVKTPIEMKKRGGNCSEFSCRYDESIPEMIHVTKGFFAEFNPMIKTGNYKEIWTYDEIIIKLEPNIIHTQ